MQEVLTDWDGTDIGYTWDVESGNDALLSFIVIVTTPIAAILFLALFTTLSTVLDENNSSSLFQFLYGLEIPAFVLIVFEFFTSFFLVAKCTNFSCFIKAITAVAIFLCGYFFTIYAMYNTDQEHAQRGKCKYIRRFLNFLRLFFSNFVFLKALIALTSISFIPLILLVIVYPAEILCTVIIYLSLLTMSAVILSPLTIASVAVSQQYVRQGGSTTKKTSKNDKTGPGTKKNGPPTTWTCSCFQCFSNTAEESTPGNGTSQESPPGNGTSQESPPGNGTSQESPPGNGTSQESPPGNGTSQERTLGNGTRNESAHNFRQWLCDYPVKKDDMLYKSKRRKNIEALWDKVWDTVVNMKQLLLILAVFFNVSLAAMLLCLLYMQALLAGATSNVAVNFVLIIITALIPGGLIYGTGKAVKKKLLPGEMVYLITDGQLGEFQGPYEVRDEVDEDRCLIEVDNEIRIVKVSALMKKKEHEKLKKKFVPGEMVYLITDGQIGKFQGPYKVKDEVDEDRCLIEVDNKIRIVKVSALMKRAVKKKFIPSEMVYLIADRQIGKFQGPYKVRDEVDEDRCLIEVDNEICIVKVSALMKKFFPGEMVYLITDRQLGEFQGPYKVRDEFDEDRYLIEVDNKIRIVKVSALMKRAVKEKFFPGEMVYLITDGQIGEFQGPYEVRDEVDEDRCLIEVDNKIRIVKVSALMKKKEHEKLTSTPSSSTSTIPAATPADRLQQQSSTAAGQSQATSGHTEVIIEVPSDDDIPSTLIQ